MKSFFFFETYIFIKIVRLYTSNETGMNYRRLSVEILEIEYICFAFDLYIKIR